MPATERRRTAGGRRARAGERSRTSKDRSPPGPKPGASASSGTPAGVVDRVTRRDSGAGADGRFENAHVDDLEALEVGLWEACARDRLLDLRLRRHCVATFLALPE